MSLCAISTLLAGVAEAQITCFQYGGGMISCDGPNGLYSLQQEFSPGMGVISGQSQYGAQVTWSPMPCCRP